MIVATAGHVDHGKTTLVRSLTHIDTDQLPEEKRRGMTIEPGFAHADFGGAEPVSFVDLPGHERFARHMLSGITAVDAALLVIAADDGVMPQTREHLAVLDLLGVTRAAVALTKIDRCDAARQSVLALEIASLLAPTPLHAAPIVPLCVQDGRGLTSLQDLIAAWQRELVPPSDQGRFRMAIDRCFHRPGAGRVVAGAVMTGTVGVGDLVAASPSGEIVRVRSVQVHGQSVDRARRGQRCALNIVPAVDARHLPERGDWLLDPALHGPTTRVDVHLQVLADAPRTIEGGATLQVHLGATMCNARLVPLDRAQLAPGERGFVQLMLDRPVSALWGDRWILRDAAAQRVVGGAQVLDPAAPARGRAQPTRQRDLQGLALADPALAFAHLLAAHPEGVEWPAFRQARALEPDTWRTWSEALQLVSVEHPRGQRLLRQDAWTALQDCLLQVIAESHQSAPDRVGLAEADLLKAAAGLGEVTLLRAALRAQLQAGQIVRDGFLLRRPDHQARLSPQDEALLARVVPAMLPAGLRPVPPGELAPLLGLELAELSNFLQRAAGLGHLVQIAKNRFFLPSTITTLIGVARACAEASPEGRFEVRAFRDRSGIGRNLSVQVLEFFDRCGITRYAHEWRAMADDGP